MENSNAKIMGIVLGVLAVGVIASVFFFQDKPTKKVKAKKR
jgi:hypothetical protein